MQGFCFEVEMRTGRPSARVAAKTNDLAAAVGTSGSASTEMAVTRLDACPSQVKRPSVGGCPATPTDPVMGSTHRATRTVTNGFVRSNVLLPIGGKKAVSNPVPQDLSDLSGWTREELEVGLEKQYDVDVADVTRFLYSTEGEAFLKESINGNYHPYYSQQNDLQAVRSAIILDAEDGKLSSYGMMAKLPTDQRLQGAMKVCNADVQGDFHKDTSLLSWYMNTPACIQAYTAKAEEPAPAAAPVQGLW